MFLGSVTGTVYLLHLVKTLPQVLVEIRFHSGHDALQLNPLIQQLPVVLRVDEHTQHNGLLFARCRETRRQYTLNNSTFKSV